MKTGLADLRSLVDELEVLQTKKADYVVRSNDIVLDENLNLNFGDQSLKVTEHTHNQIGQYLNIPAKYYDKMRADSPELLRENVNHWLAKPDNQDKRLVRALDGRARALLSNSYQRIDNYDVATATLPPLREVPGLQFKSMQITERKMYIKVVSTEITGVIRTSARAGDMIEAGVIISNSEIGQGAFSIEPFFNFLVCNNGLILNKHGLKKRHLGAKLAIGDGDQYSVLSDNTKMLQDKAILSEARDIIFASMDRRFLDEAVSKMEGMTGNRIEGHIPRAVEEAGKILQLTQTESDGVLRHLIEGADLSQYGLMNAVTRTAEDLESYDRATELEAMGGQIINLPASDWKVIAQAA